MSESNLLVEEMQFVEGFPVVDLSTGANNGDWVSMANYKHLAIVFAASVGTAGQDPTITLNQATSAAGAGSKALSVITAGYHKTATTDLSGTAAFTKATQAAGNTFTVASSANKDKLWVVEIDADMLDTDNGFSFVQAAVADVGANAQLGYLLYILSQPRYPAAAANMVSAIA